MYLNDLNHGFDRMAPTAKQKERMLDAILEGQKNGAAIKPTHKVRWKTALVAAAAVFALTATTVLAVDQGWHEKLIDYFGIGEEQTALIEGAVGAPAISVTNNGTTVEVLQTITDMNGVYILFEVTLSEEVTFPESMTDEICLSGFDIHAQTDGDWSTASYYYECLSLEENKLTMIGRFSTDQTITNGKMNMRLKGIGYSMSDGLYYIPVVSGEWNLEWDLVFEDTSRVMTPDEEIGGDGWTGTVAKISASPLSIYVNAHARGDGSSYIYELEELIDHITITFLDGSQLAYDATDENSSFDRIGFFSTINPYDWNWEQYIYVRFDDLIDPEQIESVMVGDTVIAFD